MISGAGGTGRSSDARYTDGGRRRKFGRDAACVRVSARGSAGDSQGRHCALGGACAGGGLGAGGEPCGGERCAISITGAPRAFELKHHGALCRNYHTRRPTTHRSPCRQHPAHTE